MKLSGMSNNMTANMALSYNFITLIITETFDFEPPKPIFKTTKLSPLVLILDFAKHNGTINKVYSPIPSFDAQTEYLNFPNLYKFPFITKDDPYKGYFEVNPNLIAEELMN